MSPVVSAVLGALAERLFAGVMPVLPAGYLQADVMLMALLLTGAAEDYDRAAENRSQDLEELRAIFRNAIPHIEAGPLRAAMAVAADCDTPSLRVSDLDACSAKLFATLIDLHAFVETRREPWARDTEKEIWALLRATTERRAFSTTPF